MMIQNLDVGDVLIDDCDLQYKVIEFFQNSLALQPLDGCSDQSCEIITYECLENEEWKKLVDLKFKQ